MSSYPQTTTNNNDKLKEFILRDDEDDQTIYEQNMNSCHDSVLKKSPSLVTSNTNPMILQDKALKTSKS